MFENVTLSDDLTVPAIVFKDVRVLFEPDESVTPDDPMGVFPTPTGALLVDSSKPRIYKKWLSQIMSGNSDSQRYKGLPMCRISGTDTHGNPYAVVVVGELSNTYLHSLGNDWAGYSSGHAYNIRVQDFKAFGDSGIWTYRDPDSVVPFFGDPTIEPYNSAAIVKVYNLLK